MPHITWHNPIISGNESLLRSFPCHGKIRTSRLKFASLAKFNHPHLDTCFQIEILTPSNRHCMSQNYTFGAKLHYLLGMVAQDTWPFSVISIASALLQSENERARNGLVSRFVFFSPSFSPTDFFTSLIQSFRDRFIPLSRKNLLANRYEWHGLGWWSLYSVFDFWPDLSLEIKSAPNPCRLLEVG